jgi:hypothetical protein
MADPSCSAVGCINRPSFETESEVARSVLFFLLFFAWLDADADFVFVGSVSMLEANKLLKSQIKSISIELSNATYNWSSIATCLLNVLKTILAASPSIAAHCCLALSASISFSLKLKQLLRQNSSDISSLKLLVANLFTIGCSGDGDTDDILHSVCNAGAIHPAPHLKATHATHSSHSP